MYPDDAYYTEDHEWIRDENGEYVVGITGYATEQLGDVTFVELPEVGADVHQGEAVASVESVKAASDVYAPVTGHIFEVNDSLETQPEMVNEDPHDRGWFFKMEKVKTSELRKLMNHEAYAEFVKGLEES
jgi:glycine cleavage system H protein